ncbi:MAG: dual specificity protein phosphatase family protein [Phycisphaerae bacterium]|nr:dual specificity protein phosphatase family protein [Phycisphaerae bacterium]
MNTQQNPETGSSCGCPFLKRRPLIIGIVVIALIGGSIPLYMWGRYFFIPKRFDEVVPGHLYRSGKMEVKPMKRVLDQYHIHTILTLLAYNPDDSLQEQESKFAKEKNIRIERISMPGTGLGTFDDFEKAAAMIADESTHPLLVHCAAGSNRTGAVIAVWRMKYCGWDFDRAYAEVKEKKHGRINPKLEPHLKQYYQERIVTTRPAAQPAAQESTTMPAAEGHRL